MKNFTLTAFALACSMGLAAQNLVKNPDFEGMDGSFAPEWLWVDGSANQTSTTKVTASQLTSGADGAQSAMAITAGTATMKLIQQIPLEADEDYTLSYYYKVSNNKLRIWSGFAPTANNFGGIVYLHGSSGAANDPLRTNNGYLPEAAEWTKVSYEFTVPTETPLFNLEFRTYTAIANAGLSRVVLEKKVASSIDNVKENSFHFANGHLFLKEEAVVEVYSITGTKVRAIQSRGCVVDLSDLAKGAYIVRSGKLVQKIAL